MFLVRATRRRWRTGIMCVGESWTRKCESLRLSMSSALWVGVQVEELVLEVVLSNLMTWSALVQTLLFSYITLPHPFHFSLVFSLLVPVPEAIDAYINASKTVLKQGEPLTVNCTVHGVELVNFSWDIPNRGVSRSGAEQALLFRFPFVITLRPLDQAQIISRCGDTPHSFYSAVKLYSQLTLGWYCNNWVSVGPCLDNSEAEMFPFYLWWWSFIFMALLEHVLKQTHSFS